MNLPEFLFCSAHLPCGRNGLATFRKMLEMGSKCRSELYIVQWSAGAYLLPRGRPIRSCLVA